MSFFTVVVIIWAIYQAVVSLIKKGKQQNSEKVSAPLKLPDSRSIREVLQETQQGSWWEQKSISSASLKSVELKDPIDHYIQTEGIQEVEAIHGTGVTQGVKGTSAYEGAREVSTDSGVEGNLGGKMPRGGQALSGCGFSMTNKELSQGVIWAEILGQPRALRPFKRPRS